MRELVRLPGISQKTAQRLAFHVLKAEREDALRLAEAIRAVKEGLSFCRQCRNIAEGELCEYCLDPKRDQTRILVVEEPSTTYAIERAGAYRGLYHVLLGALSPLDGVGPSDIRTEELVDRVKLGGIEEVILATSPTIEGEATAIYLTNQLKPLRGPGLAYRLWHSGRDGYRVCRRSDVAQVDRRPSGSLAGC